jgi:hypothetical protein
MSIEKSISQKKLVKKYIKKKTKKWEKIILT